VLDQFQDELQKDAAKDSDVVPTSSNDSGAKKRKRARKRMSGWVRQRLKKNERKQLELLGDATDNEGSESASSGTFFFEGRASNSVPIVSNAPVAPILIPATFFGV
jgi:hypothetical protein